jgi:hypothetical protein
MNADYHIMNDCDVRPTQRPLMTQFDGQGSGAGHCIFAVCYLNNKPVLSTTAGATLVDESGNVGWNQAVYQELHPQMERLIRVIDRFEPQESAVRDSLKAREEAAAMERLQRAMDGTS